LIIAIVILIQNKSIHFIQIHSISHDHWSLRFNFGSGCLVAWIQFFLLWRALANSWSFFIPGSLSVWHYKKKSINNKKIHRIYHRWRTIHTDRCWDLNLQRGKVLGMTRYIMKRLSKETAKVMGRQLGKWVFWNFLFKNFFLFHQTLSHLSNNSIGLFAKQSAGFPKFHSSRCWVNSLPVFIGIWCSFMWVFHTILALYNFIF